MAYMKLLGKRDSDASEEVNARLTSDADYSRIAEWAAWKYFPAGVLENGVSRAPTSSEVFKAFTDDIFKEALRQANEYLENKAAAEAKAAVMPIQLIPQG